MPPLQTVEPQRLYRQIAGQLRALISQGELAVGSRLPAERDLAKQLGVSRPSVREALIAMEVEGWVEVRTGSGIYVLDRSSQASCEHGDLRQAHLLQLVDPHLTTPVLLGSFGPSTAIPACWPGERVNTGGAPRRIAATCAPASIVRPLVIRNS